jgi:hypothetical protein
MLQRALEDEVRSFLGRDRYAPGGGGTGYRTGHGRAREIGIGTWSVEVRPPRISDLPPGAEPFSSGLLPGRRYLSQDTQRLFARLYLEGLSSGDFEPAFRSVAASQMMGGRRRPRGGSPDIEVPYLARPTPAPAGHAYRDPPHS